MLLLAIHHVRNTKFCKPAIFGTRTTENPFGPVDTVEHRRAEREAESIHKRVSYPLRLSHERLLFNSITD